MSGAPHSVSPTAFTVLAALADGARSGVDILEALEDAEARILGPGSLYRLLKELRQAGWVEEAPREPGADGRLRSFRLTGRGRDVLRTEAGRLDRLLGLPGVLERSDGGA